jgi:hypothetical protein
MVAETKSRSLDDGKFRRWAHRFKHEKILAQGGVAKR